MANETDRLLIGEIRIGDARAWERLIGRYEGRLRAFIHRRIKNPEVCDDLVQETFVGFLTSLPNFDDQRELQTFLFSIASYKIIDHLRKIGRHPLQNATDGPSDILGLQLDVHKGVSSAFRSQERRLLENDAVARHLGKILHEWRDEGQYQRIQVMELLWVKGWANCDVAQFLKLSEQQIANIRFATAKKLRESIQESGLPADVFPELNPAQEASA